MNRILTFAALFTSVGTLFCCALPALFVVLGAGATFAAMTDAVPGLLLLGEYKTTVFIVGAASLALGWLGYRRSTQAQVICEITTPDSNACDETKQWTRPILFGSTIMYILGFSFAYLIPLF